GLWTSLLREETHAITFAALPVVLVLGFVAGSAGVSRLRRGGSSQGFQMGLAPALRWRGGRERRGAPPPPAPVLPGRAAEWELVAVAGGLLGPAGGPVPGSLRRRQCEVHDGGHAVLHPPAGAGRRSAPGQARRLVAPGAPAHLCGRPAAHLWRDGPGE